MFSGRGFFLASLLLLPLLAVPPGAVAQTGQPFFQLDVKPDAPKTITENRGFVLFYFNVTVRGQSQGNQLADQFIINVQISRNASFQVPNGWAISDPVPSSFAARAGSTRQIEVRVATTIDDPSADKVTPSYDFVANPTFQGQSNPLTDALVQQMGQRSSAKGTLTVERSLTSSEQVISFASEYRWLLILAAIGLVVLALTLVRRRKAALSLFTEQPVQEVLAGRGASFPIQLRAEGSGRQSISLTTSQVPQGWAAILPVDKIELAENESTTIWLTLKAPGDAQPGQRMQASVVATTESGVSSELLVEAAVVEHFGGDPFPEEPAEDDAPEPAPKGKARAVRAKRSA